MLMAVSIQLEKKVRESLYLIMFVLLHIKVAEIQPAKLQSLTQRHKHEAHALQCA